MAEAVCPRCGFRQDGGTECFRCGIVFHRYKGPVRRDTGSNRTAARQVGVESRPGTCRRCWRVLRWVSLAACIVCLSLIFRTAPAPRVDPSPAAAGEAEARLSSFQESLRNGRPDTLRWNQDHVNAWMKSSLNAARPAAGPHAAALAAVSGRGFNLQQAQEAGRAARGTVSDVRMSLSGDQLRAYVLFDFHGMDMSLELEGRLVVRDGYLRLDPVSGRLGSLPLPRSTLESAAARLFDSPENRETFHLSPEVAGIRIENGELVVTSR